MPNYILRVFKSWGARDPERRWSNNYEIVSPALGPEGLDATIATIVEAEQLIHGLLVHFLSATVSTWTPDSDPYNPLTFQTQDLAVTGLRSSATDPLDSNVCYVMRFICPTGRNGRRFFRGVLLEGDVSMGGDGRFTLTAGSPLLQPGPTFAAYNAKMAPLLSAGVSVDKVALIGETAPVIARPVVSVLPGGVSVSKRNHRYFDRAA